MKKVMIYFSLCFLVALVAETIENKMILLISCISLIVLIYEILKECKVFE